MLTCTNVCTFLEASTLIFFTSELVAGFFFFFFFPFKAPRKRSNTGTQKSTAKVFKKLRGVEAALRTTRPCSYISGWRMWFLRR